jgi:hypothetical protein
MTITPELIPHSEFHTGIWLRSTGKEGWYYFVKKHNKNLVTSIDFLQSVDEPLRDLVKFLQQKGIRTTPSCAGHHINEKDIERVYRSLIEDGRKIRNGGLTLKDVQTGEEYFYREKAYNLPWNETDFKKKLKRYQQKGVLGIRLGNRKKLKNDLLKLASEGFNVIERDSLVLILTDEKRQEDNNKKWKEITARVKEIFVQLVKV